MAIVWDAGAVFFVSWMVFFFPIAFFGTVWFWRRREIQPIKARSPGLVLIADFFLLGWILLTALQRVVGDEWPCSLTLWGGQLGSIALCNAYIWRCWVLYFTFNLTQQRLENRKIDEEVKAGKPPSDPLTVKRYFFIKHRHLIRSPFLIKFLGSISVVMMLPCAILSATNKEIAITTGDSCNRAWGDYVLASYMLVFLVIFIFFAYTLRGAHDGFYIRQELKLTGTLSIPTVFVWLLFNNVGVFKTINNTVFPFSTLSFTACGCLALIFSTLWPLFRSIFQPPVLHRLDIANDLGTLEGILRDEEGHRSFQKFLTKEFSVENILFWREIEEFRKQQFESLNSREFNATERAQAIMQEYIVEDSPFQVNLPGEVVQNLFFAMKTTGKVRRKEDGKPHSAEDFNETVFDECQADIFKLMDRDSFPRYIRGDLYKTFIDSVAERIAETKMLIEEGVV